MKPQNWNDVLAIALIVIIPTLWILKIDLSREVDGALIATWTLIIQYYFRKSPPK